MGDTKFGESDLEVQKDFRPFDTSAECRDTRLCSWNAQTGGLDTIYHLGNFGVYDSKWEEHLRLVSQLRAKAMLIVGNVESAIIHNEFNDDFETFRSKCLSFGFENVSKIAVVPVNTELFLLMSFR